VLPSSVGNCEFGVRPAATPYALPRSAFAWVVAESTLLWIVPVTIPAVMPVIAGVGSEPTSPVIALVPVFVIAEPARSAKFAAVPRSIVVGPRAFAGSPATALMARMTPIPLAAMSFQVPRT
jgi:hypothetical protein